MDFKFPEELEMLRQMIRKFVDQELKPIARKIDEEGDIPADFIQKLKELGFFGLSFPEEYGGVGAGEMGYCIFQV